MDYDKYEIATNYNQSRQLPEQTMQQWLTAIGKAIPRQGISMIVDLGCGTGRFSNALAAYYQASVIGIDPSQKMLAQAKRQTDMADVRFMEGTAEAIPLPDNSVDLLFLSMVYHHIADHSGAHDEFRRVLKQDKYLCIRNSVTDLLDQALYLKYFPSAKTLNEQRLVTKAELVSALEQQGFSLMMYTVISQLFAANLAEYAAKVGQRSLSDLNLISDQEFADGKRAMEYDARGHNEPIFEPIVLCVFQKT